MSIGKIVSGILGVGGDGGAGGLQRAALEELAKIQFPSIEEQKLYLENLVQQGIITPEQATTFQQNPSAFRDMSVDATGRDAQVTALKRLQTISDEGGMTAIDKARAADINAEIGTANRGAQDAIVQNAAERGVSGSGVELAARLSAQQGGATRAAAAGTNAAADAQVRALQALQSSAGIGANVYGADAELAARKAEADDAINRFNTGNAQAVEMSNVESRNAAQGANLAEKQRVADTNVGTRNSQQAFNKGLAQQDFNNRMSKAAAMTGQYNAMADTKLDQARRQDAMTGELVGAGGQILAGYKPKGKAPAGGTYWKGGKVRCADGGRVPGNAPHPGDHPDNDVVNARLSPGEIVVPRSAAASPKKAAAFAADAAGAHPDDIEAVLSALSKMRASYKPKKKVA